MDKVLDLIDDCIACGIDKLIEAAGWHSLGARSSLKLWKNMYVQSWMTQLLMIAQQVETILTTAFAISKKLKGRVDLSMAFALSDIKAQIEGLIFKGFATECGWKRLAGYSTLYESDRAPNGKTADWPE